MFYTGPVVPRCTRLFTMLLHRMQAGCTVVAVNGNKIQFHIKKYFSLYCQHTVCNESVPALLMCSATDVLKQIMFAGVMNY